MSFNKGKEERKWRQWKEAEEKIMRQYGVDEKIIEQFHIDDWAVFNSDRRYYEKLQETGTYLDDVVASEQHTEINTVEDFLNEIENKELYKMLLTVDRLTLQIVLMKIQGYATKEISVIVHLTPNAIYGRMDTLRKKLKDFKR